MTRLLVASAAPAIKREGSIELDVKFYEGMRFVIEHWDGDVGCVVTKSENGIPFPVELSDQNIDFDILFLDNGTELKRDEISKYDVILCSDNYIYYRIFDNAKQKIFYIIENTLKSRILQILYSKISILRKMYLIFWLFSKERARKRAFRAAYGLQINGYPAEKAYKNLNCNRLFYLDNRMRREMIASDEEMEKRCSYLKSGAPVRLIHSGRLEPMKGSQDLVSIATLLRNAGVKFELNVFGTGSLEDQMSRDIKKQNLENCVFMRGVADFASELVPFACGNADIFLSCHRQSDPSCSYLESMGCGLAVIGYANEMWSELCRESQAGWVVGLGDHRGLAELLQSVSMNRIEIVRRSNKARDFALARTFESEFSRRLQHLKGVCAIAE